MVNGTARQIIPKIIPALLLAGCAGAPPTMTTVQVPVYVPCVIKRPQRPAFEFDQLPLTASEGEKVLALARDWGRGRKYEAQLEAVVAGCAGSESDPKPRTIAGGRAQ